MNLPPRQLGIAITCLSFLSFTVMDTMIKWVGTRCPSLQAVLIVNTFSALVVFIYATRSLGLAGLKTSHLKLHILRGILLVAMFGIVVCALHRMPLANFLTLFFSGTFFVVILSSFFLHETVGWSRWAATIAGFAGVVIVLRPSLHMDLIGLALVFASFLYGVEIVLMQWVGRREANGPAMFYRLALSVVILGPALPFYYAPLEGGVWVWLIVAGLFHGIAQLTIIAGFRLASTPVAAPFQYTQIIWAVLFGWLIWRDVPDWWTAAGSAIIIASGLYLLRRESGEVLLSESQV